AFAAISESHGYAQFGILKYPQNFTQFDWVNPDAPKGGVVRLMSSDTFDTLNSYIFTFTSPSTTPGFFQHSISELNEPLMVGTCIYYPSGDHHFLAYGLRAEATAYHVYRRSAGVNGRDSARIHDRQPFTGHDAGFCDGRVGKHGHPRSRKGVNGVRRVDNLN